MSVSEPQKVICDKFGAECVPTLVGAILGISRGFSCSLYPLNGLRHPPQSDTSGWYIWSGEHFSQADDFFMPIHIEHLKEDCPEVLAYLGLPPGWRFLLAPGHEDVWFDSALIVE